MNAVSVIAWSFPGAGYRNETGALTNVGTNGYYWSTSPNVGGSSNSGYLKFVNDGTLTWTLNGNRVAALSVRCVSELTTDFYDSPECGQVIGCSQCDYK